MTYSNNVEKIKANKDRKAWNETVIRKGAKLNKTKRDRTDKRAFIEMETEI